MWIVEQLHRHPGRAALALFAPRKCRTTTAETVINALINQAHSLPDELVKLLIWNRGKEMSQHKRFRLATHVAVYFCDPQNPRQRDSNENTNGLLRQYFPKEINLSVHSQERLDEAECQINGRPAQDARL